MVRVNYNIYINQFKERGCGQAVQSVWLMLVSHPNMRGMTLPHLIKTNKQKEYNLNVGCSRSRHYSSIPIHKRHGSLTSDRKPHLSREMFTSRHPLFTDDNTHPQVLLHGHVWLLEEFHTAQLPLDISAEGPT